MQSSRAADTAREQKQNRIALVNGQSPSGLQTGQYRVYNQFVAVVTHDAPELVDLTATIHGIVAESGVTHGQVVISSTHTTAAIVINENEPLLARDMEHFLERIAPKDIYYGHNDFSIRTVNMHEGECPNGHAHCQHLLLGTSETMPVMDGRIVLGQWQSVFLVELDEPKTRRVAVQVSGI